jgi:YHS domain-containing protein
LRLRVICAAAAAAVAASCFLAPKGRKTPASQPSSPEAMRIAINRREFGSQAYCAVTGKRFEINAESRAAVYHGRTHYFRDEEALRAFLATPGQYEPDSLPEIIGRH